MIHRDAAFSRWFGASKVVDERGEPLVVWHASRPGADVFDTFDFERAFDVGVHFGTREAAETFGGTPQPYFLKIENPLRLVDPGDWLETGRRTSTIDQLAMLGLMDEDTYGRIFAMIEERKKALKIHGTGGEGWLRTSRNAVAVEWRRMRAAAGRTIAQVIQRTGHDGVVYENTIEGDTSWMVFEPTQIKSADRNSGAFNPSDPSFLRGDDSFNADDFDWAVETEAPPETEAQRHGNAYRELVRGATLRIGSKAFLIFADQGIVKYATLVGTKGRKYYKIQPLTFDPFEVEVLEVQQTSPEILGTRIAKGRIA